MLLIAVHISLEIEFVGMKEVVECFLPLNHTLTTVLEFNDGEVGQDKGRFEDNGVGAYIVEHHKVVQPQLSLITLI
jgi:hypothetical protein